MKLEIEIFAIRPKRGSESYYDVAWFAEDSNGWQSSAITMLDKQAVYFGLGIFVWLVTLIHTEEVKEAKEIIAKLPVGPDGRGKAISNM